MTAYQETGQKLFTTLHSSDTGLSQNEAEKRIQTFGKNVLASKNKISKFKIFISQFQSFVVYILFAALFISALLEEYVDSIVIAGILIVNAIMGFIQEYKAEKSLEALAKLSSPQSTVERGGKTIKIDSSLLVPGDILLLEAGDKVSADGRILSATHFKVDESSLTGESVGVNKHFNVLKGTLPLGDQKNMVFSGTTVLTGNARVLVVSTGMQTEIGKIAKELTTIEKNQTPLQENLEHFGKILGYLILGICVLIFIVGLVRQGDFQIDAILSLFIIAVALAVAAVPEGLAIVVTIALSVGVQLMVKKNALIRKLPSVETLGCTTVICSDKTGTLTKNQMTVEQCYFSGKTYSVTGTGYTTQGAFFDGKKKINPSILSPLLRCGFLNNNAHVDIQKDETKNTIIGDPTEGALLVSAKKAGLSDDEIKKAKRLDELPFDSERKMMSTIHAEGKKYTMYTKGAPERVLAACVSILDGKKVRKITSADRKKILETNTSFATNALRVLAFAYKPVKKGEKYKESGLVFLGLQGMIDPPREEVKDSIKKCHRAGIDVFMITGDHEITAKAIAKELGIIGNSITGEELEKRDLEHSVDHIKIYARVSPQHKSKIVDALQKQGHVVAMTGDGVNDAPALKRSDIGLAMGITGTEVAKESADMILLDDNFSTIVNAVEEGRGIYDNIRKFINYLLSSNLGEVLVLFFAMLIGFSDETGHIILPVLAIHLLWINLVTDGLPALALGVDPINPKVMNEAPRNKKEHIINREMGSTILFAGIMIACATLFLFWVGLSRYEDVAHAQTLAFTTLVVLEVVRAQLVRAGHNLSMFSNMWLILALIGTLCLQLLVIYTPLSVLFKTVALNTVDWIYILGTAFVVYIISQIYLWFTRRIVQE